MVVSTASTSRIPSGANSGRAASYFFARHGTIETTYRSSRLTPYVRAKWFFTVAPIICCGDLQLDRCGIRSGYRRSTRLTQPGQHDVNCGSTPPVVTRFRNSVVSSMIVRSAAKEKSKILSKPIARISPAMNAGRLVGRLPYCAAITLRGAGATKPTTSLVGSLMAVKTSGARGRSPARRTGRP